MILKSNHYSNGYVVKGNEARTSKEHLLVHSHCIIHRAKILNQPSVHVRVGRETEEYSYNKTLYHFKSKFYYLRLDIILNKPGTKGQVPHDLTYMRNSKPFNSE